MSLLSRLAVQAARAYGILSSDKNRVSADYLVVAGGGGGAGGTAGGGGGGAGGLLTSTATLSTLNTYSIAVGAGGNGGAVNTIGSQGNNSSISGTGLSTITSTGGGYGGYNNVAAGSGGSGGGGGGRSTTNRFGGAGTSGQGYAGGDGLNDSTNQSGAGGGGAGAVGGAASGSSTGGAGGNGVASSISGSSVTYAGGGGGAGYYNTSYGTTSNGGLGGSGGGGTANSAGTVNLGGGGGGGGGSAGGGGAGAGAAGGSGIVIISYTSAAPKFVGGTITTSGGKQIHTFTSSGTLTPVTEVTASYLVVAGGGGSGGGGGGAGGYQTSSITLYSPATYIVTVGAGGAGVQCVGGGTSGVAGSNSVLSGTGITTVTSIGGGYGGGGVNGGTGGSGGGSGSSGSLVGGGSGTSGQGNNGGGNGGFTSTPFPAGGGGGAGAVGGTATSTTQAGNGGAGTASSISGSSVTYAGGGGGGYYATGGTATTGGSGGGGAGNSNTSNAVSGTPNTGGGGGGTGPTYFGGSGGSGVVIISYAGSQVFNGGLVTTSGGNTIHTFTSSGALTPLTNNLNNSLRFRSSASAYLSRTPSVAGNRKTWTWSAWVKLGKPSDFYALFGSTNNCMIGYGQSTGGANFGISDGNTSTMNVQSTNLFRDPSAWYHFVLALDTTQATAANRVKMYVNGNQITSFANTTYPSQNAEFNINNTTAQNIGRTWDGFQYFDGYMTDINFIDGQALEPYYFGNNDANGVWKPIQYKGTYGTNGFYLTFGNTTSTTTLGYDSSPNGNNWTTNNISLTAGTTYDAMTDVPTNTSATVANYAVFNPLYSVSASITNANLSLARSGASGYGESTATISPEGNKGYFEITCSSSVDFLAGFIPESTNPSVTNYTSTSCYFYKPFNGNVLVGTGASTSTLISGCTSSATNGQIVMVAFDFTGGNRNVWFGLQGTWGVNASAQTGVPSTGAYPHLTSSQLTTTERFYFSNGDTNTFSINFGQRPFSYTPPTGFVALNTYNLPTPTIIQGNRYMDATLYTGNGSTQTIVNAAQFKPDFVWEKTRSVVGNNMSYDSVSGVGYYLHENLTNAQGYNANTIISFNSNGFTVGATDNVNSTVGTTGVAWQWQAGQGTNTTNTNGSITSTVSVSTTAGFSVVLYTGNGGAMTIGHGLGVAPKMIILKDRDIGRPWPVYHGSLATNQYLILNTTAAAATSTQYWNNTAPTSTVFSVNGIEGNVGANGEKYVAYCWAEIAGFSKFGSYTGNGSADGPMVYCNFAPKFILVKRTDSTSDWRIWDTRRTPYNAMSTILYPNTSDADYTASTQDFDALSNGFKVRNSSVAMNASGGTYIYACFASNPFKSSNAF